MSHPPQTPQQGQPGWPVPPAAQPKKKRTGLVIGLVLGAVVLLCMCGGIVAAVSGGGSSDTGAGAGADNATEAADPDATDAGEPAPKAGKIGQPVRDGKFEFTVSKVKCGVGTVGSEYFKHKAGEGNQFCLVRLTVENIGDEPQLFSDSDQYAYDAAGRKYSPDSEASIYANGDGSHVIFEEINPGSTLKGTVVFKISKQTKLATLELHDSSFSGGVEISLA